MRISQKVNVVITVGADNKNIRFGDDDALAEVVVDSATKESSGHQVLAANGTITVALPDGVTTGQGICIVATGDFNLRLNGGADTLQCRQQFTDDEATVKSGSCKFFFEGPVTGAVITAIDAGTEVGFAVWGKP